MISFIPPARFVILLCFSSLETLESYICRETEGTEELSDVLLHILLLLEISQSCLHHVVVPCFLRIRVSQFVIFLLQLSDIWFLGPGS